MLTPLLTNVHARIILEFFLMAEGSGYVNRGPDERADGILGKVLGGTQRALSFRSTTPPKVAKKAFEGGGHIAVAWPPFFSLFIPRGDGRFRSFRIGYRWDGNWGDGQNPDEPADERAPGGYILDVINKPSIKGEVLP